MRKSRRWYDYHQMGWSKLSLTLLLGGFLILGVFVSNGRLSQAAETRSSPALGPTMSTLSDKNKDNQVDAKDLILILREWRDKNLSFGDLLPLREDWQKDRAGESVTREVSKDNPAASPTYEEALALFQQSRYPEAGQAFEQFIQANPMEARLPDAEFHRAFCFYLTGDYDTFGQLAEAFRANYPQSTYCEGLAFHQAFVAYNRQSWQTAVAAFYPDVPGLLTSPERGFLQGPLLLQYRGHYGLPGGSSTVSFPLSRQSQRRNPRMA